MKSIAEVPSKLRSLFSPATVGGLELSNRIVMAPMTRFMSPGGVPTDAMVSYYARRAAADVGLIITEGTWIDHPGAGNDTKVPDFFGEKPLAGWTKVLNAVHAAGGKIMPQLWHIGLMEYMPLAGIGKGKAEVRSDQVGPSGYVGGIGVMPTLRSRPMTQKDIGNVIEAYGSAASSAYELGFDGVAIHGAHGYLIDQFFWDLTNKRTDRYGGDIRDRTAFAVEVVQEMRRQTAPNYPIMFRFSQWKLQNYDAKLFQSERDLAAFLEPLTDAGVDIFDCSERRFWLPVFKGSELNLAGWTRKLTGKPTVTVGSVGLNKEMAETFAGEVSLGTNLDRLLSRLDAGEFDLVGVGRALLADPEWATKAKMGALSNRNPWATLWESVRLSADQRQALLKTVENVADPAVHGVVRWRLSSSSPGGVPSFLVQ
jgi:2,4-dienoyl-CoA reductase-like NADH-dependent reductase (Old Yellow Enzyme family)